MAKKPISMNVTLSSEDAANRAAVNSDGSLDVNVSGAGYSSTATVTRPADTTAYTAGDVVGGVITFSTIAPSAIDISINSTRMLWNVSAIPSGASSFFLALYSSSPPSAYADNAVWDLPSGDRASFLGIVQLGGVADLGSTLYVEQNDIGKQVLTAGTTLYAYAVTNGGYTPAASEVQVFTIASEVVK